MKREALRHPKMLDLAARLRIPREHAVGTLDVLLDWVHDMAPQGDVGKWPDGAITVASGWPGDPNEFINALIGARWLDSHPRHRLLVHDYPDHAERFVKAKLAKNRQWFRFAYYSNGRKWDAPNGIMPPEDEFPNLPSPTVGQTTERTTGPPIEPTVPCDQTKPNQTKPNHPQPQKTNSGVVVAGGGNVWTIDSEAHARLALQGCGYKRFNDLITECHKLGLSPQDIVSACEEYEVNISRFTSPGAIAERLRTGGWPADGVVSVDQAQQTNGASKQEKLKKLVDSLRLRLIKEVDNNARNWDESRIISEAKARWPA